MKHKIILGKLFPLDIHDILNHTTTVVAEWYSLGVWLSTPHHVLEEIRANNPQNIVACKEQMLLRWMNSHSLATPSCWWSLLKAIKGMGENLIAQKIENNYGKF